MSRYSITDLLRLKEKNEKIVSLACYTYPTAQIADDFCELILVGDSVGMVLYGMDSTLGVDMNMLIAHGKAVSKATSKAFIMIDMPYGSYEQSPKQALENAQFLLKETSAQAVKLEGGQEIADTIKYLTAHNIKVIAHIGLMPQSVKKMKGYKIQGRSTESEKKLLQDISAVEDAGACAVVIEGVTENVANKLCQKSKTITIGIGASSKCDGQILVIDDLIGTSNYIPKFAKTYHDSKKDIKTAINSYKQEVKQQNFPQPENLYK